MFSKLGMLYFLKDHSPFDVFWVFFVSFNEFNVRLTLIIEVRNKKSDLENTCPSVITQPLQSLMTVKVKLPVRFLSK